MATSTITGKITAADGTGVQGVRVTARLRPAGFRTSDYAELTDLATITDASGFWSLTLERNADITPANTYYEIQEQVPVSNGGDRQWAVNADASGTVFSRLTVPAASLPDGGLTQPTGDARYAFPYLTTDAVRFVSPTGTDANDGLSPGHAKATALAAVNALPATGGKVVLLGGVHLLAAVTQRNIPNVTIEGQGTDVTILRLDPAHWANFGNNFLIGAEGNAAATGWKVRDLTLDGNHRAGGAGANQGGLLAVGNDWVVERVRFYDSNWFKLWISGVSGVRIRQPKFVTTQSGNDNIGGGTTNSDVVIEDPYWAADISGNALDLTLGSGVKVVRGRNLSTKTIIFEGLTDSSISHLYSKGKIQLGADVGYGHATTVQPRNNKVAFCEVDAAAGSLDICFQLGYNADGVTTTPGGGNVFMGNTGRNSKKMTFLVDGKADGDTDKGDVIIGNTAINANTDGSNTYNTGIEVSENAGFAIHASAGSIVEGNTALDDQGSPTMRYGFAITAASQTNTVRDLTFANNRSRNHTLAKLRVANSVKLSGDCRIEDYTPPAATFDLPTSAIASTLRRNQALSDIAATALQTLYVVGIWLPGGVPVNSITFMSGTTALNTGVHQFFALIAGDRTLLAMTADNTSTAWAANTARTLAIATPYVPTYTGFYYLGCNIDATTSPSFAGVADTNSATNNIVPILAGVSNAGITDPASLTAALAAGKIAAITAGTTKRYAYVS